MICLANFLVNLISPCLFSVVVLLLRVSEGHGMALWWEESVDGEDPFFYIFYLFSMAL